MSHAQADLFEAPRMFPPGFRYQPGVIEATEESEVLARMADLEFAPFEFHGFAGKRRVVSFGWRYDFNGGGLTRTTEIPGFLLPIRDTAATFAGLSPDALRQVLLTEYPPGSTIGWHKDRPVFGDVVGISLLSPCTLRFRRET